MTNKVKINYYTKSEQVEITYEGNCTNYIYHSECAKLTRQLLHIMKKGWEVEIIEKEYTPKDERIRREFEEILKEKEFKD